MKRVVLRRCAAAVGVLTLPLIGCGGRSALESYPGNSLFGDGGTQGGRLNSSYGGSASGFGGTFGMSTVGGMAAGGMAVGGMAVAGMAVGGMAVAGMAGAGNDQCLLSTTDCYTVDEPDCAGVRMKCQGDVLSRSLVWGTNRAHVNDLATAVDGRVAVGGFFLGLLNLDDATLPTVSNDYDGFVLVFDSEQNLLFSHFFGGADAQAVTGVHFAPGGDLVVQGSASPQGAGFVTRLDEKGKTEWSYALGTSEVEPGQIGVDNDGNITLVGGFKDSLEYRGNAQGAAGYGSYVVHLDADGNMQWGYTGVPPNWQKAAAIKLVVDDEDNLVVLGRGTTADSKSNAYVEKVSSTGTPLFLRELIASNDMDARGLAVDRKMQIVVGGVFRGDLKLGDLSQSSQGQLTKDFWFARMDRDGGWQSLHELAGKNDGSSRLDAIATDPPGNIVLGLTDHDRVLVSKRRESGLAVWDESFATTTPDVRLASDNTGNIWLASNFNVWFADGKDIVEAQGNGAVILLKLSR